MQHSTGCNNSGRYSLSIARYQPTKNVLKDSFVPRVIIKWNALEAPAVETEDIEMFQSLLASGLSKVQCFCLLCLFLVIFVKPVVLTFLLYLMFRTFYVTVFG